MIVQKTFGKKRDSVSGMGRVLVTCVVVNFAVDGFRELLVVAPDCVGRGTTCWSGTR